MKGFLEKPKFRRRVRRSFLAGSVERPGSYKGPRGKRRLISGLQNKRCRVILVGTVSKDY